MKTNASYGAITGKILSKSGLLLEAGTYLDKEYAIHPNGRHQLPYRPKYHFIREIETLSNSFTFLRRLVFDHVGGLNEKYQSLSYALADLSHKTKKSGHHSIYHPLIELVKLSEYNVDHDSAKDIEKLSEHHPKLELIEERTTEETYTRRFLPEKKLLFIDIFLPEYDKDSGSLRAYHLLKMLKQLGYHIIFVPRKGEIFEPYYTEFLKMGIEILYGYPDRKGMEAELKKLLYEIDIAWICRPQLNKEFEWIFKINPKIKWVYDTIDLHYIRLGREAILYESKKLKKKADKFHSLELSIAKKADITITVTEEEAQILHEQGAKRTEVVSNVHEALQSHEVPAFNSRKGLLFIGSYDHPPNIDAVVWLIEEIMPLVWQKEKIPVTLLGSKPTEKVKSLASGLVKVPGFIQDVSPYFLNHKLFVAPLRYGAGMKGKIGQSLSYQLPIITSQVGAEGIGLQDGENVLIAETKEQFAEKILKTYNDESLWNHLTTNSSRVLGPYRPEIIRRELKALLSNI
ncbi:glycosyltransferase family 4 protein [Echinicola soli]|nr:glycosyltransferase family 4 protein [Echinicola soli]